MALRRGEGVVCGGWAHMNHQVQMVAHNGPGVNAAGENVAQRQNTRLNPRLSMLETLAQVFVEATQPRSAHAAVDAVKGSGLGWIDELAAGLGHGSSVGLRVLWWKSDSAQYRVRFI